MDLDQRPILQLTVNGVKIIGLLDTGADKSIIASKDWPRGWSIHTSSHTLQGLGYAGAPNISANLLNWQDTEGHSRVMQPYVLELPVSLWGRDLMKSMGFKLSNEYSEKAQTIMKNMGCHPNFGLGRYLLGRKDPLVAELRKPRQGMGFS